MTTCTSRKLSAFPSYIFLALVFIPLVSFSNGNGTSCYGSDRPNFVFLVSEDNSKHYLKLFDPGGVETPNIASLAQSGLLFRNAFSNAPVCSVARTTLMTSCYGPRIGTQYHRCLKQVPLPKQTRMFPALLRQAGYYTTNRAKKDYNCIEGKGVWDESSRKASWRKRKPGQPFFHMQTFTQSHEGSLHFSNQWKSTNNPRTETQSVRVSAQHPNNSLFQFTNAIYRDRIQIVDKKIGAVIDQLKKDGLLEDTIIFYFGDHGGVLPGSKGYLFETGLHVPLIVSVPSKFQDRVGFELTPGQQIDGFVSFVDFGPTVLELAGVSTENQSDGKPFLGATIHLDSINRRQTTIGYADRFDEKYDLVRSVRAGKYKYIRNFQPFQPDGLQNNYRYKMLAYQNWRELFVAGKLSPVQARFFQQKPAEQLFDVESDPWETNNLAALPDFESKRNELRHLLNRQLKSWPDLGFYPESFFLQQAADAPADFGTKHRDEITKLIEIADLMLEDFDSCRDRLQGALESPNSWERYWALNVCSSFGEKAESISPTVSRLAQSDPEILNRVRAAEFLAISSRDITRQKLAIAVMTDAIQKSTSRAEQAIILNTVVLLRDFYGMEVPIERGWFNTGDKKDNVERRLEYLLGSK